MARAAALALLAPVVALGCADGASSPPEPSARPARIVTLAPSITEAAFALGLGDRIVGVDDYSRWPPGAAELPRLGGLLDPRLEAITTLRPDLAVLLPGQRDLGERLAGLGIEVLEVPSDTLADVEEAAMTLAERCGVEAAGRRLVARLRRELAPAPMARPPSTALVVGRQPGRLGSVLVAGRGTYLHELLERLGADNVFADVGRPYPQVGLEAFLERRPRAVIELQGEPLAPGVGADLHADWLGAPGLALDGACVTVVDGYEVLIPGPRLPQLYRRLRAALEACG